MGGSVSVVGHSKRSVFMRTSRRVMMIAAEDWSDGILPNQKLDPDL